MAPALAKAVQAVGGVVAAEMAVKPWELPRWVCERAAEIGLQLDVNAAKALIARVGERQQRLVRELEKIALELGPGAAPSAEEVDELCAGSSERKAWTLADAMVAGDEAGAMRALVELRGQGERVTGLLFTIVRRIRDAHDIAMALAAGEPPAQDQGAPAHAAEGRRPADRRRPPARCRGLPARAGAPRRPRARDPRRRGVGAQRGHGGGPPGGGGDRGGLPRGGCAATSRAARDFLRLPVLRCSAPVLTALSIVLTRRR